MLENAKGHAPETLSPDDAEDFAVQLDRVADHMATLSEAEEYPVGFSGVIESFEASEVRFDSGDWIVRLGKVLPWLNVESVSRSELERDPALSVERLFEEIAGEKGRPYTETPAGFPKLTWLGAEVLANRLDSAAAFQSSYLEDRESSSHRRATEGWRTRWEEEGDVVAPSPEPVRARTAIWPIQEFADKANKRKLNLSPTYQRGDVWPTGHRQQLIESVLRGIPLPSIILLRPQESGGVYEVVDGKQRLTSLLRFIGQHPKALEKVDEAHALQPSVDFKRAFREDYKEFRRLWALHRGEKLTASKEGEYYFPFKLAPAKSSDGLQGDLSRLAGKYYYEIKDERVSIGEEDETVGEIFESVSNYKVPLIEYLEATPRQIHEVFNLYNRQGKHLTAEEIRNALYHELKIMRLLMVASGDNPQVEVLASYLDEEERRKVQEMGAILTEYRFGVTRYKRTKLLSWLTALLMQPSLKDDGALAVRSTAKQIDEMLVNVEDDPEHPLRSEARLKAVLHDLHECLDAHAGCDAWAAKFKDDGDGKKWQELQLVGSLVGVFLMSVVSDEVPDLLDAYHDGILEFTEAHPRPEKTQNVTQWGFIGTVALGLVERVEMDLSVIEAALLERFGVSCIPTLEAARRRYAELMA